MLIQLAPQSSVKALTCGAESLFLQCVRPMDCPHRNSPLVNKPKDVNLRPHRAPPPPAYNVLRQHAITLNWSLNEADKEASPKPTTQPVKTKQGAGPTSLQATRPSHKEVIVPLALPSSFTPRFTTPPPDSKPSSCDETGLAKCYPAVYRKESSLQRWGWLSDALDSLPMHGKFVIEYGSWNGFFSNQMAARYPSATFVTVELNKNRIKEEARFSRDMGNFNVLPCQAVLSANKTGTEMWLKQNRDASIALAKFVHLDTLTGMPGRPQPYVQLLFSITHWWGLSTRLLAVKYHGELLANARHSFVELPASSCFGHDEKRCACGGGPDQIMSLRQWYRGGLDEEALLKEAAEHAGIRISMKKLGSEGGAGFDSGRTVYHVENHDFNPPEDETSYPCLRAASFFRCFSSLPGCASELESLLTQTPVPSLHKCGGSSSDPDCKYFPLPTGISYGHYTKSFGLYKDPLPFVKVVWKTDSMVLNSYNKQVDAKYMQIRGVLFTVAIFLPKCAPALHCSFLFACASRCANNTHIFQRCWRML